MSRWPPTYARSSRTTPRRCRRTPGHGAGRSRGASTSCASGTRPCRASVSSTSCATAATWPSRRTRTSSRSTATPCSATSFGGRRRPYARSRSGIASTRRPPTTARRTSAPATSASASRTFAPVRSGPSSGSYGFFGLEGDVEAIPRAEVRPPDTLGRWKLRPKRVIEELNRTAEPTLRRFGYL
jgi:hypothetical protein